MITFSGRRARLATTLLLLLTAVVPLTVWHAGNAVAASGCTFAPGSEVQSKSWYLKHATKKKSINIKTGKKITADQFGSYLKAAKRSYSDQWGRDIGWYRTNGAYSFPVDMAKDSCESVFVVATGTNSRLWVDVCIAPATGQNHSVCAWKLPTGLSGLLYAGSYNPKTQMIATINNSLL